MSIVKLYNKKSGVTYVYESQSYWDKEKQQPRNKRKLIGKLDPATGEIIPTGKSGRKPSADTEVGMKPTVSVSETKVDDIQAAIDEKDREIEKLKIRIKELEIECRRKDMRIDRIRSILEMD